MKKLLLGATALAVISSAGIAAAQSAAPAATPTVSASNFNARIGGFMTAGIGYVDADEHDAGAEIVNNAEVIFNFTLAADNGINFGAKVEFEANGTSENADEYVATVSGVFGSVEIGREDGAADRIGRAPGNTAFTAAADEGGLLFDYASPESPVVVPGNGRDTGDTLKITYFTPRFAGFQVGASYVPGSDSTPDAREFGQGGTSTVGADDDAEGYEFGATYRNTFGAFSVNLGAAYVSFEDQASVGVDDSYTFVGAVGFAGFTFGGTYHVTSGATNNAGSPGSDRDRDVAAGGLGYATGPWTFGVQYAQYLDGPREDDFGVSIGADYALAPGVTVGVIGEYASADEERFTSAGESLGDDAYATGVFMNLAF
jgi:predicted porin